MAGKCVRPDFSISLISVCTLSNFYSGNVTQLPRGPFQEREPRKMTRAAGGVDSHTKVLADSPLEGEPSVPRGEIAGGTDGLWTRRWREVDSNFRFRAAGLR
jgi:hypothetical protein